MAHLLPVVVVCHDDAQGLEGLPETHVVAEDPVEFIAGKEGQPVHTILVKGYWGIVKDWWE